MSNTANLKKEYAERIAPALKEKFHYTSTMQIPVLKKIVVNQGLGMAVADKKIIDDAINELTAITGQKAVATISKTKRRTVTETETETMKIELEPEKAIMIVEAKENTTTPDTVVVFHRKG